MSKKNNNKGLYFLSGVIAGAFAAYYVQTPEGKRMLNKASEKGAELKESIIEKSSGIVEQAEEKVNEIISKTNDVLLTAKENLNSAQDAVDDTIDETLSGFERGMNKAKIKLNQNLNE